MTTETRREPATTLSFRWCAPTVEIIIASAKTAAALAVRERRTHSPARHWTTQPGDADDEEDRTDDGARVELAGLRGAGADAVERSARYDQEDEEEPPESEEREHGEHAGERDSAIPIATSG